MAREYKKRGIPLDVFVIDYYHWPRCGDYRFDEEYFPDPKAMIDESHEMGIETMVSIRPQIDLRSENYEEMKQRGDSSMKRNALMMYRCCSMEIMSS